MPKDVEECCPSQMLMDGMAGLRPRYSVPWVNAPKHSIVLLQDHTHVCAKHLGLWIMNWRGPFITLSCPTLSITSFSKLRATRTSILAQGKCIYVYYLFLLFCLPFQKYNCLRATLHDCKWCFNEDMFSGPSIIRMMNGECVFCVLNQDGHIFSCCFGLRQGRHSGKHLLFHSVLGHGTLISGMFFSRHFIELKMVLCHRKKLNYS